MQLPQFSAAFQESVRWLLALHDVMSAGRSESPEAEDLRTRMEKPWYAMADEEQELIDGLSADLYTIGQPRAVSTLVADQDTAEFERLINEKSWASALEFLRDHEAQLPPDDVACIRGICWASLDQPAVADRFFLEALRLKPGREDLHQAYQRFLKDHRGTCSRGGDSPVIVGPIVGVNRAIRDYALVS